MEKFIPKNGALSLAIGYLFLLLIIITGQHVLAQNTDSAISKPVQEGKIYLSVEVRNINNSKSIYQATVWSFKQRIIFSKLELCYYKDDTILLYKPDVKEEKTTKKFFQELQKDKNVRDKISELLRGPFTPDIITTFFMNGCEGDSSSDAYAGLSVHISQRK